MKNENEQIDVKILFWWEKYCEEGIKIKITERNNTKKTTELLVNRAVAYLQLQYTQWRYLWNKYTKICFPCGILCDIEAF